MLIIESFNVCSRYYYTYGKLFLLHLSILEFLIVADPKWLQIIMNSPKFLKKSREYDLLHEWLGDGLLTSKGKI